ncbi:hypothetical protein cypCar_00036271 [Cyprinus carpio]|nr:hypothetical protein cypCar_00036271 [Cyprinus carpio]
MTELEVDQSNLPRVQEVCQCFAVLEDGALAYNLQEQETLTHSAVFCILLKWAGVQTPENTRMFQSIREERDSEYACMIQEEIQRRADEARGREVKDEEIAKRIQEEEELYLRHMRSYQNKDGRESTSIPARPYLPRPVHVPHNQSPTRKWQQSSSPTYSDSEEDLIEYSRPTVKPTVGQRKLVGRPSRAHLEQDDKSMTSQSSSNRSSHLSGGWGDVIKLIKNDMSEQGYLSNSSEDDLFEPVYKLENILRQKQQTHQGPSPLRRDCPIGDFRVAQVAQDEEIARFMQKQEIKAKRRSRELEPVREYWENDRRTTCDRQRHRLDSEGLQSPFDDFTPDNQLPGHISVTMQPQAIRNIAEELDPTFQRKDSAESEQINGSCQNQTSQQVGLNSPVEEPTFVPPTKQQSDKLGRVKHKKKKENAKQKENCKQQ